MAVSVIAAGIGAAASASSASKARRAQREATAVQKTAAEQSLAEQRRQFDLTRSDFAGQRGRGEQAGELLAARTGALGAEEQASAFASFVESPGQAFLRDRQERALTRNAARVGGLGGGNVLTALQEQAFGIAQADLARQNEELFGLANIGAGATSAGAQIGTGISRDIASGQIAAGQAQAGGILREDVARQSGLANIAGAFTGSGLPGQIDDFFNPLEEVPLNIRPQGG